MGGKFKRTQGPVSGVQDRHQGVSPHRYQDNPLEKLFALAWQAENTRPIGGDALLEQMMKVDIRTSSLWPPVTGRERKMVNTVIQWLGSPSGQWWLSKILSSKEAEHFRERLRMELDNPSPALW